MRTAARRRLVLFVAALAALSAAATVATVLADPPADVGTAWTVGIFLALVASELLVFHYRFFNSRHTISLSEVVLCAAVSRLTGGTLVLAVALAALVARLIRRQDALKLVFNVSQYALAASAAAFSRSLITDRLPSTSRLFEPGWRWSSPFWWLSASSTSSRPPS